MTTIINAVSGTGLTQTADGSGVIKLQSNGVTTNALAWVNFNGTTSPGTVRSSYNVSSVTRNATGDYTVNFSVSTTDANYVTVVNSECIGGTSYGWCGPYSGGQTTSGSRVTTTDGSGSATNRTYINVAIFGN